MSAKSEAEQALEHLVKSLAGGEPLEGLSRFLAKGTAEYALNQVRQIQELKRARRAVEPLDVGQPPAGDGPSGEQPFGEEAP